MKRTKEQQQLLNLSNRLTMQLRHAVPEYRRWRKRDFIRIQSSLEDVDMPHKSNLTESWNILCRFAARCDVPIPTGKVRSRASRKKPNTKYNGSSGFTAWRKIRYDALLRANGSCDCCGHTSKTSRSPLHVDHIKPKSLYPELEFKLTNLQVLCADCNIGKGNWDETNWREINEQHEATEILDMELIAETDKFH